MKMLKVQTQTPTKVKSTDKLGANQIQTEENTGRLQKKQTKKKHYNYHKLNKIPTQINFSKCF